jgi:geranylgeranyl pyrophosphate synthase
LLQSRFQSILRSPLGDLPTIVGKVVGGERLNAARVSTAWKLVYSAAKLLDDVEDGDITDDVPAAINKATGILFAAQIALSGTEGLGEERIPWQVSHMLQRAILRASAGQHADLKLQHAPLSEWTPDKWMEVARAKSGELFGWAAWAGAFVSEAKEETLGHWREFGSCLGTLLQVADDFNGVWAASKSGDLQGACFSLPVCYALSVTTGEQHKALMTWLHLAAQGYRASIGQIQQLLTELGTVTFLLVAAREQYLCDRAALDGAADRSNASELIAVLDQVFPAITQKA